MPPPLHPPGLHFHELKKRATSGSHGPAAMARRGLAAILYKLRDVHRPPSSPSSSSPRYRLCYPPPPSAWAWPSCRHPRTSSFRARHDEAAAAAAASATMYRTVNTVYDASASEYFLRRSSLDEAAEAGGTDRSFLAVPPDVEDEEEDKEQRLHETAVVCAVRSERLFFDPAGAEFLSKQQPTVPGNGEPAPEAVLKSDAVVAVTVESEDPHGDFRASMAEMVAAHGLRDWAGLEELLAWYLKLNGKGVHGVIVGAFVDLLVSLTSSSPSSSSSCITFEEESCS